MSGSRVHWIGSKMLDFHILKKFPGILSFTFKLNCLILVVHPVDLKKILYFLTKSELMSFSALLDLWIVDNLKFYTDYRFQSTYLLYSYIYQQKIFIRTSFSARYFLDSISDIFPAANWLEREAWDLFGIFFKNHPDLRRILTDYGFIGHPLLKDFPLTGYVELRFDLAKKKVVQEKLKLVQEYRYFDFLTPWNTDINSQQ